MTLSGCRNINNSATFHEAGDNTLVVKVLIIENFKGLTEAQIQQHRQLNTYMGKNMVRWLNKYGYRASLAQSHKDYRSSAGEYLLTEKVLKYNPGNVGLRIGLGFGAGSASLDVHYKFYCKNKKIILSDDHGVGSSRNWTYCAEKNNKDIIARIGNTLNKYMLR
ncbi:MAG: DUF4410 domain-containing protein [Desulfosarcina sp.]|nr:DUF4410 domain-containing protein [Desulfobacterales bacterium]